MWDDDGVPKLVWSPTWAVHISATGEERKIYGLSREDAHAMCRIYDTQLIEVLDGPVLL